MSATFFGETVYGIGSAPMIGVGDVGDLLAYRQEWQPFIGAHLELWRYLNQLLESVPEAKKCPSGLFDSTQLRSLNLNSTEQAFCASLVLSRMYTSDTHPLGILPQWNAWKGKSSADIVAGADEMLSWHQSVVMKVGGPYKDELIKIANLWNIKIDLPDVPDFTTQQQIIARIEGAYITTKGVLQIIGYGIGETLMVAGSTTEAVAEGLQETAKAVPAAVKNPIIWIGVTAVIAIVGGALIVYYKPRQRTA